MRTLTNSARGHLAVGSAFPYQGGDPGLDGGELLVLRAPAADAGELGTGLRRLDRRAQLLERGQRELELVTRIGAVAGPAQQSAEQVTGPGLLERHGQVAVLRQRRLELDEGLGVAPSAAAMSPRQRRSIVAAQGVPLRRSLSASSSAICSACGEVADGDQRLDGVARAAA